MSHKTQCGQTTSECAEHDGLRHSLTIAELRRTNNQAIYPWTNLETRRILRDQSKTHVQLKLPHPESLRAVAGSPVHSTLVFDGGVRRGRATPQQRERRECSPHRRPSRRHADGRTSCDRWRCWRRRSARFDRRCWLEWCSWLAGRGRAGRWSWLDLGRLRGRRTSRHFRRNRGRRRRDGRRRRQRR